jgi:hypothetical protein
MSHTLVSPRAIADIRRDDHKYHRYLVRATNLIIIFELALTGLVCVASAHDGFTPDGRSSNSNGLTQGGSNADNVLADAFIKGLDTNPKDNVTVDSGNLKGRGALGDWINVGWLTRNHTRSHAQSVVARQHRNSRQLALIDSHN